MLIEPRGDRMRKIWIWRPQRSGAKRVSIKHLEKYDCSGLVLLGTP